MSIRERVRPLLPWARLIIVLLVGIFVVLPIGVVVVGLQWAGARGAWLPTMVVFATFGAAVAWLAVNRRYAAARRRAIVGLGALCGLLGVWCAHVAPPTYGRLRAAIVELEQPGWRLFDDDESGNAICLDTCNTVTRTYHLDALRSEVEPLAPQLRGERGDIRFDVSFAGVDHGIDVTITASAR
ncbi:MAG: hypothetical protein QOD30_2173 [Actinomycetota bacterium]|jgi:hypothetical protein|nr:hypothetical protein [Actinomycetota bacterium]